MEAQEAALEKRHLEFRRSLQSPSLAPLNFPPRERAAAEEAEEEEEEEVDEEEGEEEEEETEEEEEARQGGGGTAKLTAQKSAREELERHLQFSR